MICLRKNPASHEGSNFAVTFGIRRGQHVLQGVEMNFKGLEVVDHVLCRVRSDQVIQGQWTTRRVG